MRMRHIILSGSLIFYQKRFIIIPGINGFYAGMRCPFQSRTFSRFATVPQTVRKDMPIIERRIRRNIDGPTVLFEPIDTAQIITTAVCVTPFVVIGEQSNVLFLYLPVRRLQAPIRAAVPAFPHNPVRISLSYAFKNLHRFQKRP